MKRAGDTKIATAVYKKEFRTIGDNNVNNSANISTMRKRNIADNVFEPIDAAQFLPPISPQQAEIVDAVEHHNLIIDSVAGSGKTTTILYMAKKHANKRMLLLTYNARLRLETKAKAELCGLDILTAHTFHSLGVAHVGKACRTDRGLITFTNGNKTIDIGAYDILIIDECQDMTLLYYKWVKRVLGAIFASGVFPRLCVIGDKNQSIYRFAGADARFITRADEIYSGCSDTYAPHTWKRLQLNVSYRLTHEMANFLNKCILGEDRIIAAKHGPLPKYNIKYDFGGTIAEINNLLANGYTYDDIFILAPSVRSTNKNNPIRRLANILTANRVPIYVPMTDDIKHDEEVSRGKIVFSSFHQSKGLERRAVFVLGIDASYFKYYARDESQDSCPNVLYVALTRAKEYLSIYHSQSQATCKFMRTAEASKYANLCGVLTAPENVVPVVTCAVGVTALLTHLSATVLENCMRYFRYIRLRPPTTHINIPSKCEQTIIGKKYVEEVSEINGTAIPSYYEYKTRGTMTIANAVRVNVAPFTTPRLLHIANQYIAKTTQLDFKLRQIVSYDWLKDDVLDEAYTRLHAELTRLDAEVPIFEQSVYTTVSNVNIAGSMDMITDTRMIELKTVESLSPEHFIQTAIYAYAYESMGGVRRAYHLYNIRTDELIELHIDSAKVRDMIAYIICEKYHGSNKLSDDQFMATLGIGNAPTRKCSICAV